MSNQAKREINGLLTRLRGYQFADRIWAQILTDTDKERFDSIQDFGNQLEKARYGITSLFAELKGISVEQAGIKLAHAINMISADEYNWLLSELELAHRELIIQDKPKWDKQKSELKFLGELAKKFSRSAHNAIKVLDAFEEESWPSIIYDPLPQRSKHPQASRYDPVTQ